MLLNKKRLDDSHIKRQEVLNPERMSFKKKKKTAALKCDTLKTTVKFYTKDEKDKTTENLSTNNLSLLL